MAITLVYRTTYDYYPSLGGEDDPWTAELVDALLPEAQARDAGPLSEIAPELSQVGSYTVDYLGDGAARVTLI